MAALQQDGDWQSDLLQALLSLGWTAFGRLVPGTGYLAPRQAPAGTG